MRYFALLAVALLGCGSATDPSVDDLLLTASLAVIAGNLQTDTIEAQLADPLTIALKTDTEDPIPGALVNFVVVEEDCGRPFAGSALTDAEGLASELWRLGTEAGLCTMEARAVDSDGTAQVYATMEAIVESGWPMQGWLYTDRRMSDTDSLHLGWHSQPVVDREVNGIEWTASVVSGPGVLTPIDRGEYHLTGEDGTGEIAFSFERGWFLTLEYGICNQVVTLYGASWSADPCI